MNKLLRITTFIPVPGEATGETADEKIGNLVRELRKDRKCWKGFLNDVGLRDNILTTDGTLIPAEAIFDYLAGVNPAFSLRRINKLNRKPY